MTDKKLREFERRWKETQSVEDEAAYLLERVRAGDLEQEKLGLAAYCGHEAARVALGDKAPEVPLDRVGARFDGWFDGLDRWGASVPVRVGVLLLRAVLGLREVTQSPEIAIALDACVSWLDEPTEENGRRANLAADECREASLTSDFDLLHVAVLAENLSRACSLLSDGEVALGLSCARRGCHLAMDHFQQHDLVGAAKAEYVLHLLD